MGPSKGVTIPPKHSEFSDRHLELLIRHMLKKYPQLLKKGQASVLNPKYTVVDKNLRVPKI